MTIEMKLRKLEPGNAEIQYEWPQGQFVQQIPLEPEEQGLSPEEAWTGVSPIPAIPAAVVIGSLFDDRLQLLAPITLELEREGDFYIAKCDEFEEFGYGDDPFQAVDDFRQTLGELYWTLKEEQSRLAPGLASVWQRLDQVVRVAR